VVVHELNAQHQDSLDFEVVDDPVGLGEEGDVGQFEYLEGADRQSVQSDHHIHDHSFYLVYLAVLFAQNRVVIVEEHQIVLQQLYQERVFSDVCDLLGVLVCFLEDNL
jgi:hypothetical protein